jgi:hypothetical protein
MTYCHATKSLHSLQKPRRVRPRTTRDEWHVLVHYGHGWEHETTEATWAAARAQVRVYRDNTPYPVKTLKRRVKIADE